MLAIAKPLDIKANLPTLEQIFQIEEFLKTLPPADMPIDHAFCNGLYARSMFLPAGVLATGAIHSAENFFFIRYGDVTFWTEDEVIRVQAGEMMITRAGIKRLAFAHADTLMTNVMANPENCNDPEKLWEMFTIPQEKQLPHFFKPVLEVVK